MPLQLRAAPCRAANALPSRRPSTAEDRRRASSERCGAAAPAGAACPQLPSSPACTHAFRRRSSATRVRARVALRRPRPGACRTSAVAFAVGAGRPGRATARRPTGAPVRRSVTVTRRPSAGRDVVRPGELEDRLAPVPRRTGLVAVAGPELAHADRRERPVDDEAPEGLVDAVVGRSRRRLVSRSRRRRRSSPEVVVDEGVRLLRGHRSDAPAVAAGVPPWPLFVPSHVCGPRCRAVHRADVGRDRALEERRVLPSMRKFTVTGAAAAGPAP